MSSVSPAVLVSRRKRRKKIAFRLFLLLFIFVAIILGAAVGVFFVDKFKIKNVIVEGNSVLRTEEIRKEVEKTISESFLGIVPRDRFFSFSEDEIRSNLTSVFGRLDTVEIRKEMPSTIIVSIRERGSSALLCVEGSKNCFFVDRSGLIFEEAPFFSSGVFLRFFDLREKKPSIGQFLLEKETLNKLFEIVDKISPFFEITDIYLEDEGVYKLQSVSGTKIIISVEDDWDLVFSNFETFLEDYKNGKYPDFEYIDMRFGNKVFYKTK